MPTTNKQMDEQGHPRPGSSQPAEVVAPPAPPGESEPREVEKTRAVADALVHLGDDAEPRRVAEAVRTQTGMDLELGEIAAIRAALRQHATPPGPAAKP